MNQFVFTSKQKTVLGSFMALGVVCLLLTMFFFDDALHTRFWTNYLHNSVFFTGIAFISLFIITAFTTALAGWYTVFKRILEAYTLFLIPGLVLLAFVAIGIWGHWHHLYHWADTSLLDPTKPEYDTIIAGKSGFLNKNWYTFGTFIIVGLWIFFALKVRSLSLSEDATGTTDYDHHRRLRIWSAAFLPIAGFSSAAIIWQWVMSIDAHWYSTLFAWYTAASWFVSAIALTILAIIYLKSLGYLEKVTAEHLHDLGKYMFAISIFWTYLWFSQYMLIWYGNIGEETIYYRHRIDNYQALFIGNLIMNFVLPFLILMRNDTKRKYGTLVLVSIIVFFGHWWDFFQMIKPGAYQTAQEALAHHAGAAAHATEGAHEAGHHAASSIVMGFTIPGLLEIGTMLGFLAFFIYFAFSRMAKAPLQPVNDPYLAESLQHHT